MSECSEYFKVSPGEDPGNYDERGRYLRPGQPAVRRGRVAAPGAAAKRRTMASFCKDSRALAVSLSLIPLAFGVTGCGSIVYKDSTATYVAAGHAVTKSIADAATSLAAAQDQLKVSKIVQDASCPIDEQRIFLRDSAATAKIKEGIDRLQIDGVRSTCEALLACAASPSSKDCVSICYSAKEANCIATVEEKTAQTLATLKGDEADKYSAAVQPLAAALRSIEYGRAAPVQNALIKESMAALTAYLDLLEKAATKRSDEIETDAKKLSDRITNASSDLQSLANKQLSAGDKELQTKITSSITGLGKLAGDLKKIEQNAKDAAAIRNIVKERSATVTAFVADIKGIALGDVLLGATYKNLALVSLRGDLKAHWASMSPAVRNQLLLQRNQLDYVDGPKLGAAVDSLFAALEKSHEALVQLVLNPSGKDKQALANAAFQEFKLVATDVSALIKLFI